MNTKDKNIVKLTWPIYLELLFFMLMGVADTLMLSQYDDLAVAAVGNANRIVFLFTVLLNIVALGVAVVVSQYLGAQKAKQARDSIRVGMHVSLLIGTLVFIIVQVLGRTFFNLVNTDAVILNDALGYLRVVALGLIFLGITQTASAGLKSHGQTKVIMTVVGFTNLLNVVLNLFLIFGLWIFPELGIMGAAYATTFSKFITMIVSLSVLYLKIGVHPFKVPFSMFHEHFYKIFKIGLPSALEQFVYQFMQIFILSFLNTIGVLAVTAQIYVFNLMLPIIVFSLAVSQGNQILIGWYVGEKNYDGAYQRTLKSLKVSLFIVLGLVLIMYVNASWLLSIFTDDQEVIRLGQRAMFVVIFLEVGRLSNLVVIQALRAAGDVMFPVIIAVFSMLGVSLGFSYLFGIYLGLGIVGIFMGLAMDEILRGTLVFIRWLKRSWVGKDVVHKKSHVLKEKTHSV